MRGLDTTLLSFFFAAMILLSLLFLLSLFTRLRGHAPPSSTRMLLVEAVDSLGLSAKDPRTRSGSPILAFQLSRSLRCQEGGDGDEKNMQ